MNCSQFPLKPEKVVAIARDTYLTPRLAFPDPGNLPGVDAPKCGLDITSDYGRVALNIPDSAALRLTPTSRSFPLTESKAMPAPIHAGSNDARIREQPSLLRRRLRHETAGLHHRLDERLALLDPLLSVDRYREVLQVFLGFYAPVEAALTRLASAAGPPLGFPLRARAELIERDLLALGASRRQVAELPRCPDLPRLLCLEDMAGCLYVLEGACLGGQVIARALQRRLGLETESGASFFIGDAEATSARWRRVVGWLEGLPSAGARSDDIVASACATFSALIEWVTRQGASQEGRRGRPDRL